MKLTGREFATIIAGLRCWQNNPARGAGDALDIVATDGGTVEALNADEIDELVEMLNCGGTK